MQSFRHSTIHKVVRMAQTAIRGNLAEDTGQPVWDLCCLKCHWDRFLSVCCNSLLQCLPTSAAYSFSEPIYFVD